MSSQFSYAHIKENQFKTLAQYVPIVDRVHGPHHPEFHEVRRLFDVIIEKTKKAGAEKPDLQQEFIKLREITDNYSVPDDVCETYAAVYQMLAEADKVFHSDVE